MRALAAPERTASRRFHERLGFQGRLAPGYLGPGADRIVFERPLPLEDDANGRTSATLRRDPHTAEEPDGRLIEPARRPARAPRADVRLPARVRYGDRRRCRGDQPQRGRRAPRGRGDERHEGGVLLAGADFPSAAQVRIEIELAELGWHALDAQVVRVTAGESPALAAAFA